MNLNPTLSDKELKKLNKIPSPLSLAWKEIRRDRFALFCLCLFVFLVGGAFIGGFFFIDEAEALRFPSFVYRNRSPAVHGRLGTDGSGRDMFLILILSMRNSLALTFTVVPITQTIGNTMGLFVGYYAGYFDLVVMRIVEFFIMVPTMMVIIVIISLMPHYGVFQLAAVLIFMGWFAGIGSTRARTLQEGRKDYVSASKTLGTPNIIIIFKKVLPNVISFIMVGLILGLAGGIGLETGLTILGYGLPTGTPSIGFIIANALRPAVLRDMWWQWFPGVFVVFLLTLSIYGIGYAISRAVNPRQRR